MHLFNHGLIVGAVLPFDWCLHIYLKGSRRDAFLRRLADAKIGRGIDLEFLGRRFLLWKVDGHGSHGDIVEALYEAEARAGKP